MVCMYPQMDGRLQNNHYSNTNSRTVLQSKHFQPLTLHMNPSVIQFPCVPQCVAAMQSLLHFTSTLMCFPEHWRVLFILVICQNSANRATTETTRTATHQPGCMGVQTRRATRRLNTAHTVNTFLSRPVHFTATQTCSLSACVLCKVLYFRYFYIQYNLGMYSHFTTAL